MTHVWVTRDEPSHGPLAMALKHAGLTPVVEPVLETKAVSDARKEIATLEPDDWLVLTSPRAILAVALPEALVPRVAVVGRVSAEIARSIGLRVEFVSSTGDASGVWQHIQQNAVGMRVCFPRSSRTALARIKGVDLCSPILYEVNNRCFDQNIMQTVDVVCFASPSAVHSVAEQLGTITIPAATIGPTTTHAVEQVGWPLLIESPQRNFASLAAAIADIVESRKA